MLRYWHCRLTKENQFPWTGFSLTQCNKMLKQLPAPFRWVNAPDIEKERAIDLVPLPKALGTVILWRVYGYSCHRSNKIDGRKPYSQEVSLFWRIKDKTTGQCEETIPHAKVDGLLVVSKRN